MKIVLEREYIDYYQEFLKPCGYIVFFNNGELEAVRRWTKGQPYPRYHIKRIEVIAGGVIGDLHKDIREHECSEKEGENLKREARRIKKVFERELEKRKNSTHLNLKIS